MSQPSLSSSSSSMSQTNDMEPGTGNPIPLLLAMFQKELERVKRYHDSTISVSYVTTCMPAYFDICASKEDGCRFEVHVFKIGQIILAQFNRDCKYVLGVEWDPDTMHTGALEEKVSICCEYISVPTSKRATGALFGSAHVTGHMMQTAPGDWKLQKLENLFKEVMLTVPSKYRIYDIYRYDTSLVIRLRHVPLRDREDTKRRDSNICLFLDGELVEIGCAYNKVRIICRADSLTREAVIDIQKLIH
jgi:hypothetical protein